MKRIHLAHGILKVDGRLLLVASKYRNHEQPLWNVPGGRQRDGETLDQTVRREFSRRRRSSSRSTGCAT